MLRPTAHVLVLVMLLASGRLLACGLECLDEFAVSAEASCHQESAPAVALNGDAVHACLPEVAEPRVTVAKPVIAQLEAAPLVDVFVSRHLNGPLVSRRPQVSHSRAASPYPTAFVLRI